MERPTTGRPATETSSESTELRRNRLADVLRRLSALSNEDADALPDELVDDLELAVAILTHQTPLDRSKGVVLDSESVNAPAFECGDSSEEAIPFESSNKHFQQGQDLVMHVRTGAGRATVTRRRNRHFKPQPELDDEEQKERTLRSQAANDRRAFREAADYCIEMECRLWITMTFDDQHLNLDPARECGSFLRRTSRKYKKRTGRALHYRGVVASHGGRPHLHALLSADTDVNLIREQWRYGAIDQIIEIDDDEIETKVAYMIKNLEGGRLTYSRFLASRGERSEPLVIPVKNFDDAKETLRDIVTPEEPRVVFSQPFGDRQRIGFRFKPRRGSE